MLKKGKFFIPLEFKLIAMTVMLLAAVVVFLLKHNLETQSRDKINGAYQSQVIEARILADKVKNKITNHVQNLKSLASYEANLENKDIYGDYFQSLAQNDPELRSLVIYRMKYQNKVVTQDYIFGAQDQSEELKSLNSYYAHYWFTDKVFLGKAKTQEGFVITLYNPSNENPNEGYLYSMVVNLDKVLTTAYTTVLLNTQTQQVVFNSGIDIKDINSIKKSVNTNLPGGSFSWETDQEYIGSFSKIGNILVIVYDARLKVLGPVLHNMQQVIILGLLVVCFAIVGILFFSKSLLAPINRLVFATEKIAAGNFDIVIKDKPSDEIGVLAHSFESMSQKIKKLLEDKVESARLEQEINVAATVHKTLFPETKILEDRFDIHSFFKSASECGGDLWYYYRWKNKVILAIGDATGHGLSSAFVGASFKTSLSLVENLIQENSFDLTPGRILTFANKAVYDVGKGSIMMTVFCAILDLDTGEISYSNCGHNPAWILRPGAKKVEALACPGYRLGQQPDLAPPIEKTNQLEPGDRLFLYTDGLMENSMKNGEEFGKKRVRKILEESFEKPASEAVETLVHAQLDECKKVEDDMTVVMFEYKPSTENIQEEAG